MRMSGLTFMASNTAKPVALSAVALVLWFGAYWYWEPSNKTTRITYGLPPVPAAAVDGQDSGGILGSPIAAAAVAVQGVSGRGTGAASGQVAADEAATLTPRAGPRVVPPEFTTYTVQKGDVSFEAIARRLGGGAKLAEAIKRANPFVPPTKLLVGKTQLRVPSDVENIDGKVVIDAPWTAAAVDTATAIATPPAGSKWPMSEQTHTVVAGETLSGIAAKYYSGPLAWKRVFEANRDVMAAPEKLKTGTTLRIPPGP